MLYEDTGNNWLDNEGDSFIPNLKVHEENPNSQGEFSAVPI